jgi:hypothetical protein
MSKTWGEGMGWARGRGHGEISWKKIHQSENEMQSK